MAKKKSKAKGGSKKKGRSRPYRLRGEGGFLETWGSMFAGTEGEGRWGRAGGAALLGLVLVGAAAGYEPLKERVGKLRSDPLVLVFSWPLALGGEGTWLPPSQRRDLEARVARAVSADPFDRESLVRAGAFLSESGWFVGEPTVRRRSGGVIEVGGAWRTPAAVVRWGGRDRLVGQDAALLPLAYEAGGAWPLRVVTGTWAGEPRTTEGRAAYGRAWSGGDVPAALSLLAALRGRAGWERVAGVDCGEFSETGRLVIRTVEGAEVVWGAPPGSMAPGEQSDAVKMRRFGALMEDPGWNHGGRPRVELYTPYVLMDETVDGRAR